MTTRRLARWQAAEQIVTTVGPILIAAMSGVYTYLATGSTYAGIAVALGLISLQK